MAGESIKLPMSSSEQKTEPVSNSPIVRLVNPPNPMDCLDNISTMWLAAHHVDPINIVEKDLSPDDMRKMIWNEIIPVPAWQTVLECVKFTFVIYNMSRAAQQQLTRQRFVGFNNNSLRILKLERFYDDKRYRLPPGLNETQAMAFNQAMMDIQVVYLHLLQAGLKQEDARGILPLNIHSPTITMTADLRSLLGFIPKRLCFEAQDEMNEFAVSLKREIDAWDHWFGNLLSFPCARGKECVIGPAAADRCKLPYPWKGGENKGLVITSHKEG